MCGFTCLASNASRAPRKERPSDDAGRLKRYREYPHCLRSVRANCAPRRGGLGGATRTPVRPSSTAVPRQSRGLRNRSVDVFGARSTREGDLAMFPRERIRDVSGPFLLPNTLQRAPVPCLVPAHRHQPSLSVHSTGCRLSRPENRAFHDAPFASADRATPWGRVLPIFPSSP